MSTHATHATAAKEETDTKSEATPTLESLADDVERLKVAAGLKRPGGPPAPITTKDAREIAHGYGGSHLSLIINDLCDQLDLAKPPAKDDAKKTDEEPPAKHSHAATRY
jgi:hypothetical protein